MKSTSVGNCLFCKADLVAVITGDFEQEICFGCRRDIFASFERQLAYTRRPRALLLRTPVLRLEENFPGGCFQESPELEFLMFEIGELMCA